MVHEDPARAQSQGGRRTGTRRAQGAKSEDERLDELLMRNLSRRYDVRLAALPPLPPNSVNLSVAIRSAERMFDMTLETAKRLLVARRLRQLARRHIPRCRTSVIRVLFVEYSSVCLKCYVVCRRDAWKPLT